MELFNEDWFEKYQKVLIWFANTWFGRKLLYIDGSKSSVGKNKIVKITPNAIFWKGKGKREMIAEFRTHRKFGKRIYYGLMPLWKLFHAWDMAMYPNFNLGFDTTGTLYPTAGDGYVENSGATYATAQSAGTGNVANYTDTTAGIRNEISGGTYYIGRGFNPFDTSTIGAGATVTAATFSLYGQAKDSTLDDTIRAVQTSQSSTTTLATADFDAIGTTSGGDFGLISALSTSAYNDLNLNATGLTWINVTGTTLLGVRTTGDIAASSPANRSYFFVYTSEQTGTTNDPKLVVTYTPSFLTRVIIM